jgi:FAD/FMN-containing dehydrogenase
MVSAKDYAHRRLVNALGPERVARGELERMVYSHDFASLPKPALLQWQLYPDFVVLPQTTEEVSTIVRLSDETGLPITPRGAGTGAYGGAVPNRGGVLVDMRKMNKIAVLDPTNRTVTVEAGVIWQFLAESLLARGFALPVVPMAAPASTVGGGINSGAVGFGSYRHGSLRSHIVDLETVLPDGSVLHTGGPGDPGGRLADLKAFFCGAEGTLGIVTKATLRIVTKPEDARASAYAFPSSEAGARFLTSVTDASVVPFHVAFLDRDHFLFERALRPDTPEPAPIALAGLQGPKDEVAEQERELDAIATKAGGKKLPADQAGSLWDRRFTMYGARRLSRGLVVSSNLVPAGRLEEAVGTARRLLRKLKLEGAVHAALVDASTALLAPYVLMDDTRPSGPAALGYVKKMGDAARGLGGHPMGLGLFMVFNLAKMHGRSTEFYGAVKRVFDPKQKINAGKTTEVWTRFTWPFIDQVPPLFMGLGLDVAAFLRRIKPFPDRYARAYARTYERRGR